ncbi:MAG: tRNA 2-thiouridine(34) synthase MnmA [Phycisphaerae bacterium]|nr:tRNA 2-thiouridine(34) synthase MnmA [Phycisphaerae bacterium]
MSGGVDSSVAAALLVKAGYDVVGVFMRLGSPGETLDELTDAAESCEAGASVRIGKQGCCSVSDAADARQVAAELGIPLYVVNFKKDFGRIIDYFVDAYAEGRTPNPCVRCNDWLKFGKLHEYAKQIGAEAVASGHYARVESGPDGPRLLRGVDGSKDQSYVLFGAPREQLGAMMLPVGGFEKSAIREMARERGLPVFDKPDSQEICFVPDNDYAGLVERRRPELAASGQIIDSSGEKLGEHGGQHRFTIGQRRGVGVALGHPIYVIDKDPAHNTVTVGAREAMLVERVEVGEANWLVEPPSEPRRVLAQYRSHAEPVVASLSMLDDAVEAGPSGRSGRFGIRFGEPQAAVAAGQAIVLYDIEEPDVVLGGGWIERTERVRGEGVCA